jgi:hypothetical protein
MNQIPVKIIYDVYGGESCPSTGKIFMLAVRLQHKVTGSSSAPSNG